MFKLYIAWVANLEKKKFNTVINGEMQRQAMHESSCLTGINSSKPTASRHDGHRNGSSQKNGVQSLSPGTALDDGESDFEVVQVVTELEVDCKMESHLKFQSLVSIDRNKNVLLCISDEECWTRIKVRMNLVSKSSMLPIKSFNIGESIIVCVVSQSLYYFLGSQLFWSVCYKCKN